MKKLCLIFSILISTIASGQYCFKYDVDFIFNTDVKAEYTYFNRMYYITQNNATPREVFDFGMVAQKVSKTVKGQLNIPAAEGPITKLWITTSLQISFGGGGAGCRERINVLYESTSSTAPVLNWGCLAFPNAVNQKLFQCSMEPCP